MNPTPPPQPAPGEILYDPAFYDRAYYGGGARGGFPSYAYDSPEQKEQLALKRALCDKVSHDTILFIGCARGFEVADAFERLKVARGLDVSTWAIGNQIPEARGECFLYNGWEIPFADNSIDLVASFDVLPHLPDQMREKLCEEMIRVARCGIVWRQIVKDYRNRDRDCDGLDGAWIRYDLFETWDERFSRSGKFELLEANVSHHYEVSAAFIRST